MATPKLPFTDMYVYALYRSDGVTPFYIGIGRKNRWLAHERDAWKGRSHKNRIILSMRDAGLQVVPKAKLHEGLTVDEACRIEREFILAIGRRPHGPLCNRTDGGEGLFNPDEEARQKLRDARKRYICSPETRAKISAAGMGRKCPKSEAHREKLRQANIGHKHTPEAIEKIRAATIAKGMPPEVTAKVVATRLANGKRWTPEMKQSMRSHFLQPDVRAFHAKVSAALWTDPVFADAQRAKIRAAMAKRRGLPGRPKASAEEREKSREVGTVAWADPVKRAARMAKLRATWEAKRAAAS